MQTIKELTERFYKDGRLEHILVRSEHRGEISELEETQAIEGVGLAGDHRDGKKPNPRAKRQVTLIQLEDLETVAKLLGLAALEPSLTRRNLVISGINLKALKDRQFKIGEAVFEATGLCHPCSRMEENLGRGGYNAMRGHGGLTARVLQSGLIRQGDALSVLIDES